MNSLRNTSDLNYENVDISSKTKARVKLENRFEEECVNLDKGTLKERTSDCNPGFFRNVRMPNAARSFRSGADKISKTFKSVKSTLGNLSQRLRLGSRRTHRLTEYSCSPMRSLSTPQRSRQILGRTPTKLYSPFGIETPRYSPDKKTTRYIPDTPEHGLTSPKRPKTIATQWKRLVKKPRMFFQ